MARDTTLAPGFNATAFRNIIRQTMLMGAPEDEALRATFKWTTQKTYTQAGPSGRPYDLHASPTTSTAHADVQIPVAIEFKGGGGTDTSVGQFQDANAEITVLDEDYELIEGADKLTLGGNTYIIDFVKPPDGLFGVTVFTIFAHAQDES